MLKINTMNKKNNFRKKHLMLTFLFLVIKTLFSSSLYSAETKSLFNYGYKTEIATSTKNFELNSEVEILTNQINKHLHSSISFQREILLNPKKALKIHTNKYIYNGKSIIIRTSKRKIYCTYFSRNSNILMVGGAGFTNPKEKASPLLDLFPDYDILLIDYKGQGLHKYEGSFLERFNPANWLFKVNTKIVNLGKDEEEDIIETVQIFKALQKPYKQTIGWGMCYSAFIFAKASAIEPNLFDKLILDGCWLSLNKFIKKLLNDPKLMLSPQYGGWSQHLLFRQKWFQKVFRWFGEKSFRMKFSGISIKALLPKITIPILFWQSKKDLTITREEFEYIWENVGSTEKTAIITSNEHVLNHLKQKTFYKAAGEAFVELDNKSFLECLDNVNSMALFYLNKSKETFNIKQNNIQTQRKIINEQTI